MIYFLIYYVLSFVVALYCWAQYSNRLTLVDLLGLLFFSWGVWPSIVKDFLWNKGDIILWERKK